MQEIYFTLTLCYIKSDVVILFNFRNYVIKLKQIYKFGITMSPFTTLTVSLRWQQQIYTLCVGDLVIKRAIDGMSLIGLTSSHALCLSKLGPGFPAAHDESLYLFFNKKTNLFMMGLNWVYTSFNIIV